ncbi:hypothetical protein PICMEDRAFT_15453 [Pichia membranifaciens NRRL Y-2026]|uniref:Cell division control protein n=1 Tax=Pichia membranifaciens NRRL Y-2026 TaxID=763406 RepID=A0A1E3NN30_9ASCO|nr:hypothetical protein PICMEDRAFT_15453 [Pichia membranifaciens NRRL Y-2026]ODQ47515.1 hypothetical protein PICMEDRAFT_15453 [Pichia membranifaciens NRRL Y-2026]
MSLKRTLNVLYDGNDNFNDTCGKNVEVKRHKKVQPLSISNDLGLLTPPVTPEHLVKAVRLSNTSLNSVSKNLNLSLATENAKSLEPKTASLAHSQILQRKQSPYTDAKNLFLRSSQPHFDLNCVLRGREKEAKILDSYITKSLVSLESGSIYVSGPPGTGKSAQINASIKHLLSNAKQNSSSDGNVHQIVLDGNLERKVRVIKFNCMSISNASELLKEIYYKISGLKFNSANGSAQLSRLFQKTNKNDCDMTILVLDEMDNIVNKSQQSLFELFTWASNLIDSDTKPNLLLIGIANALDLTDRFLPRLRANCINPKLVPFLPYTADQIKSVITTKLFTLFENNKENIPGKHTLLPPLVHPAAIQFCAKKSAVTTGDLRKAFDVMFKSIDLFEENLLKTKDLNELLRTPIESLPKVMISQVVKVCSASFNSNFELKLKPLNLQQKMILAFLFKFEEKLETERAQTNKNKGCKKLSNAISLGSFFEYYSEKCKIFDNVITQLKRAEFLEILSSLDIHGLVSISMLNTSSSTKTLLANNGVSLNFDNFKVSSSIPKMEFFKTVNENIVLKRIVHSNY